METSFLYSNKSVKKSYFNQELEEKSIERNAKNPKEQPEAKEKNCPIDIY